MIDLEDFNQDIDHNWTASEVLREFAPHVLYKLQCDFVEMHKAEGSLRVEPHTGNLYWVED